MSGSSLDHARIRRPIDGPGCSIGIHRYSFLHSESQDLFIFNDVMEARGRKFADDYVKFMKARNVGNVRRRLSVSDGQIPTVGISLKVQTENGLLEGVKLSHFSANQKDVSCWMLLSAAIT